MDVPANHVVIRVGSHRASKHVENVLGYYPQTFYSMTRACAGGWMLVPEARLPELLRIKGITRTRKTADLRRCITF